MSIDIDNHGQLEPIYRFLDSNGNGTGTKDMATTADDYYISAPAGTVYLLSRMVVQYTDDGTWSESLFGSGTALTTGIKFGVETSADAELLDITDGITIKKNNDWAKYCYDGTYFEIGTPVTNKAFNIRWTFSKSGQYLRLDPTDKFVCTIADNLSGITSMNVMVQGVAIAAGSIRPKRW